MKTRIIVDSTSDLLPTNKEQVHVVPLTDDRAFRSGGLCGRCYHRA